MVKVRGSAPDELSVTVDVWAGAVVKSPVVREFVGVSVALTVVVKVVFLLPLETVVFDEQAAPNRTRPAAIMDKLINLFGIGIAVSKYYTLS